MTLGTEQGKRETGEGALRDGPNGRGASEPAIGEHELRQPPPLSRMVRLTPLLVPVLILVTALCYLPSLSGGFLNYDDPWLLADNVNVVRAAPRDLWRIWTDFSPSTRHAYGAEYLPFRDTSHWFESRLFGMSPSVVRLGNLAIYLAAGIVFSAVIRRLIHEPGLVALSLGVFLLHPVHVESVAWAAGRKDVLALFWVAATALATVSERPWLRRLSGLFLLFACLSKSMSVAVLGLLPILDAMRRRRPDPWALGIAAALAGLSVVVHISVGRMVGMIAPPIAPTLHESWISMGPVWWKYLVSLVDPRTLSLVHDFSPRSTWDTSSALGYLSILAWLAVGAWRWFRHGESLWLASAAFFVIPLLPVSQLIVPLENRVADRYLWLSVFALSVLVVAFARRFGRPVWFVSVFGLVGFSFATLERAELFADSIRVFEDATRKTSRSEVAPYQLAQAHEAAGNLEAARAAYRATLARGGWTEPSRRATNNLARLEAALGRWDEAERVLRAGLERFPSDEKILANLEIVEKTRSGRGRAHVR